jgi:hypothetical protein
MLTRPIRVERRDNQFSKRECIRITSNESNQYTVIELRRHSAQIFFPRAAAAADGAQGGGQQRFFSAGEKKLLKRGVESSRGGGPKVVFVLKISCVS